VKDKNLEGDDRGLLLSTVLCDRKEPSETSSRTTGKPTEIQTTYLANTNMD
jgi:hypothetical protein